MDGHKTEAPLAEDSGWSQESTGGIKPHKLGSRRGAPPPLEPGDIEPATPRKETEDAEEEDDEELVDGRASDAPQDDMGDEVTARLQVMRLSLPDLANATGKLVNQLRNPQRGSRVYEYMLGSKRKVFLATRETYEGDSPFIDADQSGDFGQHTNMGASILGSANLASALDIVEMLQSKNEQGVLGQLIELDEFFHKLLVPSDDNAPEVDLSLDIRTLRLIETLAAKKQKGDIKPTIASIFCENFESRGKTDYPHLFMNAPRRPLGHREDDDVYDSCSDRITDIIGMTKDKRVSAVNRLRENFPQESILEELRKWLLSAYDSTVARGSSRRVSSTPKRAEDEFYDAEERPSGDDADSEVVSQIVRAESQQM